MIHMTMRDQYGVYLLNESAAIAKQMDTRFTRIDQQMSPSEMNDSAGEKPIRRGKP